MRQKMHCQEVCYPSQDRAGQRRNLKDKTRLTCFILNLFLNLPKAEKASY